MWSLKETNMSDCCSSHVWGLWLNAFRLFLQKNQQETTFVLKGACSSLTLDESRRRWGVQSSWLSPWWPGCLVHQRHSAPGLSACTAPDWGKSRYTTRELSTWSLKNILVLINSRLTHKVLWQQLRWWTSFLFQEGRRKAGLEAETPAELWWDASLDKIRSKNFVKSETCATLKTFVLCTELSLSFIMVYSLQLNIKRGSKFRRGRQNHSDAYICSFQRLLQHGHNLLLEGHLIHTLRSAGR